VVIVTHVPSSEFAASWALLKRQLGITAYHYKPLLSLQQLQAAVAEVASAAV